MSNFSVMHRANRFCRVFKISLSSFGPEIFSPVGSSPDGSIGNSPSFSRKRPIASKFSNAIGRFREKDGEFPIDPAGELPSGEKFSGSNELKEILKSRQNLFARCITEKLLTYALGRGLEYYDRPAVDRIATALSQNGYRFSTLIVETVKSEPFRMRRGKSADE